MNLGLSSDQLAVYLTIITLAGGGWAAYLRLVDNRQEEKMSDLKAAQDKADVRLAAIERTYISRTDHAEFRVEILSAIKQIGQEIRENNQAITTSFNGLSHRIEKVVERIAKVEAES